MKHWRILIAAVSLTIAAISASAQTSAPAIQVEHPWARATAGPIRNGVAYVTLVNTGGASDRLLAGASPAAAKVEFHTVIDDNGVMRMREVDAIDLKPGEPVAFKPGGLHVMLLGLKAPLREGESFPLTLTFEKSGAAEIAVKITKPGAMSPDDRHDHAMDGSPPQEGSR